MLLAESLARIDAVRAGSGLLLRLHGRGPGPGRLPARVLVRGPGGTSRHFPLPDGGPPPEPDTWRLAFALPPLGDHDEVWLCHGDEPPARVAIEPPMSPATAARLRGLEATLAGTARARERGEREALALQQRVEQQRAVLTGLESALIEARREASRQKVAREMAEARATRLDAELEDALRALRRIERAGQRTERPDQQPTQEASAVAAAPDVPPAPGAAVRSPGRRAAALGSVAAVATAGLLLVLGSGDERPAARAEASGKEARPPTNGQVYGRLYREAGARYGLDWHVLAAVGEIESGHGTLPLPGVREGTNAAGAAGPMQFTRGSWAAYGLDGDGDGRTDVYDPRDAIPAAASFLKAHGAPGDWRRALHAYNKAAGYVDRVLRRARASRARAARARRPAG